MTTTTSKHRDRGSLYEAAVYKCRVCDSIIPSAECAESHGQDCRPVSNYKTKSWKYKQMEEILFPCPRVVLHELPSNLSEKTLAKYLATVRPKHNPIESWRLLQRDRDKFTDVEICERVRKIQEMGVYPPRLSRFYPRDRHLPEPEPKLVRTVKIPPMEKVEALRKKYEEKKKKIKEAIRGKPNYLEEFDSSSSERDDNDSKDDDDESERPFACPLKACGMKWKEKIQLKSHFITHLENNPWACPFPDCTVKLDSQLHFQRHIGMHIGKKLVCCPRCGQTFLRKQDMKNHVCFQQHFNQYGKNFEEAYDYLKSHYERLKAKGLLLGDSDQRDIYFDFNYKINMNSIMENDPVFIKVCEENPGSWDLLFGDEPEPGTSSSSGKRNPYSNPFCCPLERCSLKFRKRSQLKSHFILHLDNNPWACPVPGCNVKLDSQPSFRKHDQWHFGLHECCKKCGYTGSSTKEMKSHNCFPQYPAPDLSKRRVKGGVNKSFELTKSHYENLKAKGLLLGNQRMLVDSDYKIDMDRLIEIDPVFLQVCKEKPEFRNEIFGSEENEPVLPQSTTSKAQEASDYNLAKALQVWERCGSSEGQLFGLVRMSYQYDKDSALDSLEIRAFTPSNPYSCPLKRCKAKVKLESKDELKSHFILHLKNNPYACPIPECKEGVNTTTHGDFQRHLEFHMGKHHISCITCRQGFSSEEIFENHRCHSFQENARSQEDEDKLKREEDAAKCCVRGHYFDLKVKGLLLEESPEHLLNFDFKFKIDVDAVIQTDPVFLQVCKHDTTFYDRLFTDELPSASTSASSLRSIAIAIGGKTLSSAQKNQSFGLSEEQLLHAFKLPFHYDNDSDADTKNLGDILPYTPSKPYACPLKQCKTGSAINTRTKLKKHFIFHLKNNPYACPIPECNVKFNAQGGFKHHLEWHMGKHRSISPCGKCGKSFSTDEEKQSHHICVRKNPRDPGQSQEDEEKLKREEDAAKCCIRRHYAYLKTKGLLLEESQRHLLEFNFKFEIDIDRIIETDPVFLKVCQTRTGFYDQIFGDGQDQQPSTSRGIGGSSVHGTTTATMDSFQNNHSDPNTDDIGEIRTNHPPDNPYACPLKKCEAKFGSRTQLKSHFIIHLKNNPFACPVSGCKVRLDAQYKFKHHMEWHFRQDQEKVDQAKFCIRKQYADLQSRGLLLEESEEHALNFNFKYKVDIDTIIQTDEVFQKVCMHDENFNDRLFGDEHLQQLQQPSTSTSVRHQKIDETKNKNDETHSESGKVRRATENEMYRDLKKLENGKNMCTLCKFESNTRIGFKRHWLSQHSTEVLSIRDEQPSISISITGESPLEENTTTGNDGNNSNVDNASTEAMKTERTIINFLERTPDEFTRDVEKHETSASAGESSPPEINETVKTETSTAAQANPHGHGRHEANKSDIYLKQLENGHFKCTQCKLSCKSEAGGKRHWLLKHKVKISSTKELPSKVGDESASSPSKKMISNGVGEKRHCSKSSRKRKSPNDLIPDTNVKAVKVEPELDLGLTLIVPKKEEADRDIKLEIPTDQIKEEGEDFINGDGDVPPNNNVQVKTEPM